jgi:hypothetical protein
MPFLNLADSRPGLVLSSCALYCGKVLKQTQDGLFAGLF